METGSWGDAEKGGGDAEKGATLQAAGVIRKCKKESRKRRGEGRESRGFTERSSDSTHPSSRAARPSRHVTPFRHRNFPLTCTILIRLHIRATHGPLTTLNPLSPSPSSSSPCNDPVRRTPLSALPASYPSVKFLPTLFSFLHCLMVSRV